MKLTVKRTALAAILSLLTVTVADAAQTSTLDDIAWFSSTTSNLLNRSSNELAKKHLRRGIKIAHRAMEKRLTPMDQLIANHNLCIGYLAAKNVTLAAQYCARAHDLAQGPYRVAKIRGANFLHTTGRQNRTDLKLTPSQVLVRNIHVQNAETRLALLVR